MILALLLSVLPASTALGAFQLPFVSPESAAMAGASLSGARDSASAFLNPAQLAGMERPDFYFMHNQMYAGMSGIGTIGQSFVSGAVKTRAGSFGFGFGMFRASGLLEERSLGLTYARKLGQKVEAGVTAKHMYHGYMIDGDPLAAADPIFRDGRSASAVSFDAGLALQASEPLRLGLAARNINSPDVGLAVEDRIPRELQAGASYDWGRRGMRMTADVTFRDTDGLAAEEKVVPAIGLEKRLAQDRFAFRVGLTPLELTAGFGLKWGLVGLDYALVMRRTLVDGNVGTHMMGLRVQF